MLGRRSLLIVLSSVITSALAFIGLFAMTNYLGKDVYGNIAWILAALATLNSVADLGFGSAHIKRVSEGMDEDDCISTFTVIKLLLTVFMVIFVFLALLVWTDVLGGYISPSAWNLVFLFVLYYVMYDIASVAIQTFTARMETAKAQLVGIVDPLIRIPLIVFVSINHMTANELAYAFVLAALGVLITSILLFRRDRFHWKKPTLFGTYIKFAMPIALITIAGAITMNLDKIMIGFFDSPGSVAYYSSSQTLLGAVGVIGSAVATLTFPSFSRLHSEGKTENIREVTHIAERYISMIGIPIATLIILFPTEVCVALFGGQFAPAGDTMRFLAITTVLTLLNTVYTSQILGVNRPDISAKIILGTFAMNVILLLVFVPDQLFGVKVLGMSYTGAAIVSAMTALAVFVSVRIIVKMLTGTTSNPRILRHILSGLVAGVAIFLLNIVYPFSGIIGIIIFGGVTLVVFFSTMTALKEFSRNDIDYFLDLLNPSKMISYMGDEMKNKK
ncbi:MAG: flippase [Methanomassiliicoccales archaeon]|jgi:O-antigen/teichoic acid export membrane protein